jgi:hypothetical protein
MRKVTQDEFYAHIGPLDVHPSIRPGPWPYTSDWKLRSGLIVGKSVAVYINGKNGLTRNEYYLSEAPNGER